MAACMIFWVVQTANVNAGQNMRLWSINPNTPFGALTDQIVRLFSEQNKETLQSEHFSNDYYKVRLQSAMETDDPPDILHNWGGSSIQDYVREGKLVDLDRLVGNLQKNVLPIAFEPVTFNGKIYGVPYSGLAGVFFWYRKDIFQKFNLVPPRTWKEFIAVGESLKQHGIVPLVLTNRNKWPGSLYYMYLVDRIAGPNFFHDAFVTGKASFNDSAFIRAGEMIQDLVRRNFFQKGFNQQRDEPGNSNSMIISGQAGMYLMGSWFLSVLNTLPADMKKNFDFFPFPEVEGGAGNILNLVGSPGQDYLSIAAAGRNTEAAKQFISRYICSKKYFKELARLGFVPPVRNAGDYLADPLARKVAKAFNKAHHVQLYYDQVMPPTMANAHKLLIHELFELRLSPKQVAESHADLLEGEKTVVNR